MRRCGSSSPARPGSSARTSSTTGSSSTRTTTSSRSTSSPTPATARTSTDVEDRIAFVAGRHRRPRARPSRSCASTRSTSSSTSPPSRTTASPSSTRACSSAPTSSARRRCSRRRGASGVGRFHHVSTCEVYGDLRARHRRGLHGGLAVPAADAVQRVEGGRRPRCARVPRDLRPAGHDHELREQLRAVPVPREGDPALRHERARRPAAADVRVDAEPARVAPRPRPLPRRSSSCSTRTRSARPTTSARASRRRSRRSPTACST